MDGAASLVTGEDRGDDAAEHPVPSVPSASQLEDDATAQEGSPGGVGGGAAILKVATAETSRMGSARATPAQVEAMMEELACERLDLDAGDEATSWCRRHHVSFGRWTVRGCPTAVAVADAVVAADARDGSPSTR